MSNSPDLSILIVNWRSADFLRKCLSSIYANTRGVQFEIIVVDNASFDGSAEMVQSVFPKVRYIQSEENLGFAKANNLAFSYSRGKHILFLNPDTEVVNEAFPALISCLGTFPQAGIVGPKLLNSDLSVQTSCTQSYPTLLNQALDAECLRHIFPKSFLWGMRPLYDSEDGPTKAEVVSGACLMIRRDVFAAVNQFTSGYFMYAEDVDLCYKVKSAGWDVLHLGSATVIHHGGQSSRKKSDGNFAAVMAKESLYSFMKVRRGRFYAATFRWMTAWVSIGRLLVLSFVYAVTFGQYGRTWLPAAVQKWTRVFRWAVGLERWIQQSA
jgi:N-acetylglucosaminyl-diphospho-decaprenol L-rhamnosyltransferase